MCWCVPNSGSWPSGDVNGLPNADRAGEYMGDPILFCMAVANECCWRITDSGDWIEPSGVWRGVCGGVGARNSPAPKSKNSPPRGFLDDDDDDDAWASIGCDASHCCPSIFNNVPCFVISSPGNSLSKSRNPVPPRDTRSQLECLKGIKRI